MRTRDLLAMLGVWALSVPAVTFAQVVDVSDCRAIGDLEKRLACYDRLAGASDAPTATDTQRSRAVEAARSAAAPRAEASRDADLPRAAEVSRAAAPAEEVSARRSTAATLTSGDRNGAALSGKIASLEQYGPQMWLIALEGGQRWRQTIGKPYRLHVGDEVRVYPTRWGDAYRLSSERIGGYIQVVRAD